MSQDQPGKEEPREPRTAEGWTLEMKLPLCCQAPLSREVHRPLHEVLCSSDSSLIERDGPLEAYLYGIL